MTQDPILAKAQTEGWTPEQIIQAMLKRAGILGVTPGMGGTMGRAIGGAQRGIGQGGKPVTPESPDLTNKSGMGAFENMLGGLDFMGDTQNASTANVGAGNGKSEEWVNPFDTMLSEVNARRDKAREGYLSTFDEPQEELPQNVQPAWRTGDALGLALPAALMALFGKGKEAAAFLEGGLKGKLGKAEMDTTLAREAFNQRQQQRAERQNRSAAALKFAEQDAMTTLELSETARKEKLAEDKQRLIDGRSLRGQFLATNNPAEAQTTARILREMYPEFAPTIEEEKRQIESLSLPEAKLFNDNLRKFRESSYFEDEKQMQAAMDEYSKQRGQLVAAGVPDRLLDPVPDAKTIKQARLDAAKFQQDRMYELSKEKFKFDRTFKLNGREWEKQKFERTMGYKWQTRSDKLAKDWAQLEIARANYGLARDRNDIAKMRIYLDQENKSANLVARQMSERVDELQRLSNARHAELLRAKWKPEKIASDPILKEMNDRISQYIVEAEANDIQLVPQVRPTMTDDYSAGPNWQYDPTSFGGGGEPGGSPQGLARIDALKGSFMSAFPGGRSEQWAPSGGRNIQGTNVPSLHNTGLALDLYDQNLPAVAEWAIRQPGVQTVIFNKRIWSPGSGWRPYDKHPHHDHVHVDYGRNSNASPTPNNPPPKPPTPKPQGGGPHFGSQNMTPQTGGGGTTTKVIDPWKEMHEKLARAKRLREMAIQKIKFVGKNGERYDPTEIRKIYEKETGLKADF